MSATLRFAAWLAAFWGGLLAVVAGAWILFASGLREEELRVLYDVLDRHAPVLTFAAFLLLAACGGVISWFFRRYVTAAQALAEQTRIVLNANPEHRVVVEGAPEMAELAAVINRLGDGFRTRHHDLQAKIADSGTRLEEERNRLAALMSELSQAVLLCNAEGRILLYNERARLLFAREETGAAPQGLVGLGRSVFALLDRDQVAHALDKIQHSLDAHTDAPVTRFIATASNGSLVRVQMAPFLNAGREIAGIVLMVEDVTDQYDQETRRRSLLQALVTDVRQPVANIRAAAENLVSFPEMGDPQRAQFTGIIADESRSLTVSIDAALRAHADALKAGLALEDMPVSDLVRVARRRIDAEQGLPGAAAAADDALWVKVDSYAFVQMLAAVAARLRHEHGVASVGIRVGADERFVHLDLAWQGAMVANDAVARWETQPMGTGNEPAGLTIRDVLERHGGEVWQQSDVGAQSAWFRFLLPRAQPVTPPQRRRSTAGGRPEFYDFNLFRNAGAAARLADQPLAELHYTVFDTETTGLEPSAGDEIISIGAVRVVNGRLLKHEVFEQLVNPGRRIPLAAVRIHGIKSRDLLDQPPITDVLPAFHRFCEDTVLVAHNAAFDMRFLELKESVTGIRFTQPVLDTLLLSAIVHPSLKDHRLEAIAERLGLGVLGRHTALGDALVTAEIFLKLVPLLVERGVATLGQALEKSQVSYYARLQY